MVRPRTPALPTGNFSLAMTASSHRARTAWPVRVCGCTGRPAEGTAVRDRPLPFSRRAIGSTEVLPRGLAVTKPPNFPRNENKTRARGDRSDRALFRTRAGRLGRCAAPHLTRLANGNSNLFASRIPRQDHGDLPDEPRDADLWQYDHRFVGRLAGARWAVALMGAAGALSMVAIHLALPRARFIR